MLNGITAELAKSTLERPRSRPQPEQLLTCRKSNGKACSAPAPQGSESLISLSRTVVAVLQKPNTLLEHDGYDGCGDGRAHSHVNLANRYVDRHSRAATTATAALHVAGLAASATPCVLVGPAAANTRLIAAAFTSRAWLAALPLVEAVLLHEHLWAG